MIRKFISAILVICILTGLFPVMRIQAQTQSDECSVACTEETRQSDDPSASDEEETTTEVVLEQYEVPADRATKGKENCHTMIAEWFGNQPAVCLVSKDGEDLSTPLASYFAAREDAFTDDAETRGAALVPEYCTSTVQWEAALRNEYIRAMERNLFIRIVDAENVFLSNDEYVYLNEDGTVTAYIYEFTFFDYIDLLNAAAGPDYTGCGVMHKFTFEKVDGSYQIVDDNYVEPYIGYYTAEKAEYDALVANGYEPTEETGPLWEDYMAQQAETKGAFYAGYNPEAAVAYADQYVKHTANGGANYGDYYNNAVYFNFNLLPNAGDCANYVSQCIHAGGIPMDDRGNGNASGWYFKDLDHRSPTWSGAGYLRNYMAANYGVKRTASDETILKGSPVFYGTSDSYTLHAVISVGRNSAGRPLINSHNKDIYHGVWNYWNPGVVTTVQMTPSDSSNSGAVGTLSIKLPHNGEYLAKRDLPTMTWSSFAGAAGYTLSIMDKKDGTYLVKDLWFGSTECNLAVLIGTQLAEEDYNPCLEIVVRAMSSREANDAGKLAEGKIVTQVALSPRLGAHKVTAVTTESATLEMRVENDFGLNLTAAGFRVGTTDDVKEAVEYEISKGSLTTEAPMRLVIHNLKRGTQYYFWAYAKTAAGESVSSYVTFHTEAEYDPNHNVKTLTVIGEDGKSLPIVVASAPVNGDYHGFYTQGVNYLWDLELAWMKQAERYDVWSCVFVPEGEENVIPNIIAGKYSVSDRLDDGIGWLDIEEGKIVLSGEILSRYPGQWIKVAIRGKCGDGTISYTSNFYIKLTIDKENCEHEYQYMVLEKPTETATGSLNKKCAKCKDTTLISLPKLDTDHYSRSELQKADCTKYGRVVYRWYETAYGEYSFYVSTPMLEHSYSAVVTPPTCTERGYTNHVCAMCFDSYADSYTSALGHNYQTKVILPTCTTGGYTTYTCTQCPDSKRGSYTNATGHRYTDEIIKVATCTEAGMVTHTCIECEHSYTETVAAKGHTVVVDAAVATTCYTDGKTEGSHCAVCNVVLKAQETIPTEGHKYVGKLTGTATCTEGGVMTYTCPNCGSSFTEVTSAKGHTPVVSAAVAPTCTTDGKTEGEYCSVCSTVIREQTPVPATGHSYVSKITSGATCEGEGVRTYTCSKCDHSYSEAVVAIGHTAVTDAAVAATCTVAGKTEGTHCAVCNAVLKAQETIPATGHSYRYTDKGASHEVGCYNCEYAAVEAHSYTGAVCICGAQDDPTAELEQAVNIRHSLNLVSGIAINYVVSVDELSCYDSFYVQVQAPVYEGNALQGVKTSILAPVRCGNYYYFTMTELSAMNMNDVLAATLHMRKGTQKYTSQVDQYSVAMYALAMLKQTDDADLKRLCADLLRYGAEAQKYKKYRTEALAAEGMSAEYQGYLTNLDTVTFGFTNIVHDDSSKKLITWKGKSLDLGAQVSLKFVFDASAYKGGEVSELIARVIYQAANGAYREVVLTSPTVYDESKQLYAFNYDGLAAAELRTPVSIAVFEGSIKLSATLEFSADTYGNYASGDLLNLCKALFAYADSAKRFFQKN